MGARVAVVPPLATAGLGRVLHGLEVVGDRNDGEQDKQEHSQGHKLHSPAPFARAEAQPQAEHQGREQNPSEIEEQLHSQGRFYNRDVLERSEQAALIPHRGP